MTAQLTPTDTVTVVDATPFAALAATLTGALHLPGTPGFAAHTAAFNVAVPTTAVAVVEALDAADVAAAVRYAAATGLHVTVQATGHGMVEQAGPVLQISTRSMRELTIGHTGAVRAGAGVRWDQVLEQAAPLGFAGLCGSAPGVSVVGFLTGGGIGPVARTYGVSSDYVTAFELVTGDGEIRRATATENPSLFWGLRGGKGALGIVTAVEFDLVPLTELLGGCLFFDGADAPAVLHAWREWTATLPEQATTSVAIVRLPAMPGVPEPLAGKVRVALRFAWVGDVEEGRRVLARMSSVAPVVFGGAGVMPYAAVGMIHSDPTDPMPVTDASTMLTALPAVAVDAIVALAGVRRAVPAGDRRAASPGRVRSPGRRTGRTPYSHRAAAYSLMTIGIAAPPIVDATRANAEALLTAVAPYSDGMCLPNFACSTAIAHRYDYATLRRLAKLAATYDPKGVLVESTRVIDAAGGLVTVFHDA